MARIIRKVHTATCRLAFPLAEYLIHLWPLLSCPKAAGDTGGTGFVIRRLSGGGRNNAHSFLRDVGKWSVLYHKKANWSGPPRLTSPICPSAPPLPMVPNCQISHLRPRQPQGLLGHLVNPWGGEMGHLSREGEEAAHYGSSAHRATRVRHLNVRRIDAASRHL